MLPFPDPAGFRSTGTWKMTDTPRSTTATFAKYSPHPGSFAPPAQTNQHQSALGKLVIHQNGGLCFLYAADQQLILAQLKWALPRQAPPRITAKNTLATQK